MLVSVIVNTGTMKRGGLVEKSCLHVSILLDEAQVEFDWRLREPGLLWRSPLRGISSSGNGSVRARSDQLGRKSGGRGKAEERM